MLPEIFSAATIKLSGMKMKQIYGLRLKYDTIKQQYRSTSQIQFIFQWIDQFWEQQQ